LREGLSTDVVAEEETAGDVPADAPRAPMWFQRAPTTEYFGIAVVHGLEK
jgi:hypothetical protein